MGDENVIEQSVTVQAPPERVYRALTDAQTLMQWFPSQAESDPRPGGKLALGWEFAKAEQNGTQNTEYTEVSPDKRVAYLWNGGPGAEKTLVVFDLTGQDGATKVNLTHSGWPAGTSGKELLGHHEGPWQFYMSNLKSYLEDGQDGRAAALGQKVSKPEADGSR